MRPPTIRSSSSFAKTTSGASSSSCGAESVRAEVADRAPRREVDAHPGPAARAWRDRRGRGEPDRLAQERVARDVEVARSPRTTPRRPRRVGARRRRRGRRTSSARRRVHERDDDAVPVRLDRACELDAELEQPRRGERARIVGAALADEPRRCRRARRPTPRRSPPGRRGGARSARSRRRRSRAAARDGRSRRARGRRGSRSSSPTILPWT